MTLGDLPIGKTATILSFGGGRSFAPALLDMGLIPKESDHGEICPYGRPYGAAHPQL